VGRSADLRRAARAEEGVVLGEECFVGEGAVLNPGVKIYPYKTVEPGAVVNASIVWESRGQRTLFGRRGVRGLANVDVTAELAVRLAAAYGTSLKKGSVVCCSRDTSRVGRTIKRAIMAGLNLSGVHVEDLELAPVPLTRFHVRSERAQGGVTVRLSPDDPATVEIRFFDAQGADIDDGAKRKIDRLMARDDFRRAFAGDIGDIVFPPRVLEYYTAALLRSIALDAVREQDFKLVLDTSFGSATVVLNPVLAKLGADVLAVNPFAATAAAAHAGEDVDARLARVQTLVRASGSHLGVVFDPDGETLRLVDDTGHALTDEECLLTMITLVTEARPGARLALPVSVSREAERIASANGATISWTKLSSAHLMEVAGSGRIDFAAAGSGGYLWPDFLPAADAVATMAKVLDLLAATGRKLSSVVAGLPSVHVAHETVSTPWERKGTVMRTTMEQAQDKELILVDGIKILHADGWALVLPDPEEPLTHVWAEGGSDGGARALAQEYVGRIRAALVADPQR
jgi:mannose-1-phosphate guanylyltransferase/phosphomannomutase